MLPGIRQLAFKRVAELSRFGIGADRIYRQIREEYGRGYTRSLIREDVFPFRTTQYLERYQRFFTRPRPLASMFTERPITTSQRGEYLWEVRFKSGTAEQYDEQFMSIVSDEPFLDADVLRKSQELAEFNRYADVFDFEITGRWHRTL